MKGEDEFDEKQRKNVRYVCKKKKKQREREREKKKTVRRTTTEVNKEDA